MCLPPLLPSSRRCWNAFVVAVHVVVAGGVCEYTCVRAIVCHSCMCEFQCLCVLVWGALLR